MAELFEKRYFFTLLHLHVDFKTSRKCLHIFFKIALKQYGALIVFGARQHIAL